jgi:ribonuclease G
MSKELFVSSTPHETKVAVVEDDQLAEIYYERENEYTLAGSIYKGRVTRVLPGMQSAFVNIGLERDAFLYVSDFLLEEEEDVEGLDQVVAQGRIISVESPSSQERTEEIPKERQERAELEPGEESHKPLEADEMIPPAEPAVAAGAGESASESASASLRGRTGEENGAGEEPEREGARKWRGRRRRRGGRGRSFSQGEAREERGSTEHSAERPAVREEAQPVRQQPAERPPIVLPGESISKYQPHPVKPAVEAPPPARTARPSTEYSFESSQFSPDSMVLPGESISKYRGQARPVRETTPPPLPARPEESTLGFHQDAESAGPVPPGFEWKEEERQPQKETEQTDPDPREEHEVEASLPQHAKTVRAGDPGAVGEAQEDDLSSRASRGDAGYRVQASRPPAFSVPAAEKVEAAQDHDTQRERFENANLAENFGGDAVIEGGHSEDVDEVVAEEPTPAAVAKPPAREPQPWHASGAGLVEEEEIVDEEESDLPRFEEDADLAEYEELEEEVLGAANEQMLALGNELTEAVRDAHINERATGQYEAEGLELHEDMDDSALPFGEDAGEEDELETLEEAEAEGGAHNEDEDLEGARAEHRAAGTAGYQQSQRSARRTGDRPGRRSGGRRPMRGGRRHHPPRRLPAISDLLKEGQEILVQIAKEPIAKKGARITSHIALPGRFVVYMPTVHHTGVSRKIASEEERHRLKRIALSERGESQGGFIVRTAAAGANEDDLRADIRFLINLWNEIRGRAESAKAPALIYHDLNLVERILRDQVTTTFSAIWVDTEHEYERILRFVSRFQPSLVKRVKLYSKETPLFEQFNITDEINKALKSKVWLKSGGYIVINQTEALVAIDVNTGKYVGKTTRLEDTIVKTNIDAIREIVRQIRLRDLGGIIVIDFIDMDERKNRHKVMQALEDALKADRAPSKVLQFNDFGLVAITRKRVKQSLERTLGQPCPTCQATGMIKSVGTVCNEIYVEMRKMSRHFERDIMLRVNPEVAKALKANGAKWVQDMEELTRRTVLVKSDALLHPEHFDIQ